LLLEVSHTTLAAMAEVVECRRLIPVRGGGSGHSCSVGNTELTYRALLQHGNRPLASWTVLGPREPAVLAGV
jgi:hypothetical protein